VHRPSAHSLRSVSPAGTSQYCTNPRKWSKAHPVDEGEGAVYPALPPCKPLLLVRFPVVDGIGPELPVALKASGGGRPATTIGFFWLIQFEEIRVCPDIDAVVGEVDREVPDDLEVP